MQKNYGWIMEVSVIVIPELLTCPTPRGVSEKRKKHLPAETHVQIAQNTDSAF